MNLFGLLEVSSSALQSQRQRAEIVASNLANAETTRTPEGGPYQRQQVVFAAERMSRFRGVMDAADRRTRGVSVRDVIADTEPPLERFEPGHPDANAEGYVAFPNVNPIEEMVDLMSASRAYQLNASAVEATKDMIRSSLDILR